MSSAEIAQPRDEERLSWENIAIQSDLARSRPTPDTESGTEQLPHPDWHQSARQRPDLDAAAFLPRNSAVDLKLHIATAYLERRSSADQLGREYGISDAAVRRCVRTFEARSPRPVLGNVSQRAGLRE